MSKRKIIFTVSNDLTYDQRMIRICGSLARAGYEVVLIGRRKSNSIELSAQPFQQKRLSCFFEKGKFFYLEYNLRLFFYLLTQSCDAICAIDLDTIIPAFWGSKIKGKKIIYDAHEYYTETPEVIRRPWIKNIWERVGAFHIPRIAHAYTVGGALQKILSEKYQTPFALIRNLPLAKTASASTKIEPPVILYQGALNEGRGISEAIRAMQYIDDAQLWLAGEGDLSAALRNECRDLGLEKKVRFLGYLTPEKLQALTPQASIGLNLLANQSLNYYYSLANKTFDYIQAEVPALHMDFPEYQQLNAEYETALLLPDLSVEGIAKALQKLLTDAALYQRLTRNCQQAAKVLVWEEEEKRMIEFYDRILVEKNV